MFIYAQSSILLRHVPKHILLVAATLMVQVGNVFATDYYWTNPVSGSLDDQTMWTPNGTPGVGDTGIFNLGSAGYSVIGFLNVSNLEVNNDTVTVWNLGQVLNNFLVGVDKDSQGTAFINSALTVYPFSDQASALIVGVSGTGTLSVNSSGRVYVADDFVIAQNFGSKGTVTVDGSSAQLETPGFGSATMRSATIGAGGDGSFSITNGGLSDLAGPFVIGRDAGSKGTVSVSGTGSSIASQPYGNSEITSTTVGQSGEGMLAVSDGASALIAGHLIIGQETGSKGTVAIDGEGSTLDSPGYGSAEIESTTIGKSGDGTLAISGGGSASIGTPVVIGEETGSNGKVTVDGSGSSLSVTRGGSSLETVTVGGSGTGSLSISNGAKADLGDGLTLVGQNSGAKGTVTVDGQDSQLIGGSLTVAGKGDDALSITDGAVATFLRGPTAIGDDLGSVGTLNIDGTGSNLTVYSMTVGNKGTGSISVTNGGSAYIESGPIILAADTESEGSVIVNGSSFSTNSSLIVGEKGKGSFSVMNGKGTISFEDVVIGNQTGSNGTFSLDHSALGGSTNTKVGASGKGSLAISNGSTAALAGTLNIAESRGSSGTVTVDGKGSTLGSLYLQTVIVGNNGTGSLSITNGASASMSYSLEIGSSSSSNGTVTVDGLGSSLGSIYLQSISVDYGSLTVSNQAQVIGQNIDIARRSDNGSLTIVSGGTLSGQRLSISDYGNVEVASGSSLTVQSTASNVGTLRVDGTIFGSVYQGKGGILSGTGMITGSLTLAGGSIAPGDSPGTLTVGSFFATNSTFDFEINSATGSAGGTTGWSLLSSIGSASIGNGPIILELKSLDQNNHTGLLFDFDSTHDYHWTFLTGSSITGFDPAKFSVDTSDFANPFHGQFSLTEVGNSLVLNYTAVPEAGTISLTLLGVGVIVLVGRIRRVR